MREIKRAAKSRHGVCIYNTCLMPWHSLELKLNPGTEIIYILTSNFKHNRPLRSRCKGHEGLPLTHTSNLTYLQIVYQIVPKFPELLTPFLIKRIHMGETATLDWLIVLGKHAILSDFTHLLLLPISKTLASSKYTL
jgi:hypothetical protein